ncbi:hypothetical protein GCM10010156_52800 [Planobispora rosea]|uniref:Secreted protein n=1 Tax=Planobispora rosea TaxID=35762 RepID=A0A8J3S679_PLARO|nr:hypothetical protein [Planobispora rosea]GGS87718.1 hypothetical protein GCM10010156_52800 [Planobispora rosea]GIH86682.1 hypothetical protein Pro02_50900 [Planobispora rosea]
MRKPFLIAAVAVLVAGTAATGAAATTPAPPKAVGMCANVKNGGYLRMLEPKNPAKSQWGKCRTTEVKVTLPTTMGMPRGLDGGAFKLTTPAGAWTCSWKADTATLACVTP